MTSKGKGSVSCIAILYLKNECFENINQQENLEDFLFWYGSNAFPRNP
jgi:hypothetical protein